MTDLDEATFDFLRRQNDASEHNRIQELRLSSPTDKPLVLTKDAKLKWLAGVFAFRQDQHSSINSESRPQLAQQLGSPVGFTSFTHSNILNYGIGVCDDATLTLWDKPDLTAGVRYDYEHPTGDLAAFNSPPIFAGSEQRGGRQFDQSSPRFEIGYHWTKDLLTQANVAKEYKLGGFNATSLAHKFAFGPELDAILGNRCRRFRRCGSRDGHVRCTSALAAPKKNERTRSSASPFVSSK